MTSLSDPAEDAQRVRQRIAQNSPDEGGARFRVMEIFPKRRVQRNHGISSR